MKLARRTLLASLIAAAVVLPGAAAAQTACTAKLKGNDPMKVKITTSMGVITAELDKAKAPISVRRKSTRLNSSHIQKSRMPSSA